MSETSEGKRITSKDIWLIVLGTIASGIAALIGKALENEVVLIVTLIVVFNVLIWTPLALLVVGKRRLAGVVAVVAVVATLILWAMSR